MKALGIIKLKNKTVHIISSADLQKSAQVYCDNFFEIHFNNATKTVNMPEKTAPDINQKKI